MNECNEATDNRPAGLLDVAVVALAVLVVLSLLPLWPLGTDRGGGLDEAPTPGSAQVGQAVTTLAEMATSHLLLLALGLLLTVRAGSVDLSVWSLGWVCSLVTVVALRAQWPASSAAAAAIGAGLAVGALQAVAAGLLRAPGVLVSAVVAVALTAAAPLLAGGGDVRSIEAPVDSFVLDSAQPIDLRAARSLVVAVAYVGVMLTLVGASFKNLAPRMSRRLRVALAFCASGALAGVAGFAWVVDMGRGVVPTRPIGDLRVVAAVVLAGALVLHGPGRTMLAGVMLPASLVAATIWGQRGWLLPVGGYEAQLLVLALAVLAAQGALVLRLAPVAPRRFSTTALAAAVAALAALLAAAHRADADPAGGTVAALNGAASLLIAAAWVLLLAGVALRRRRLRA